MVTGVAGKVRVEYVRYPKHIVRKSVMLSGITIVANFKLLNAYSPIVVIVVGIVVFIHPAISVCPDIMALQLSGELNDELPPLTVIDESFAQPERIPRPMELTFSGIRIDSILSQSTKASSPIVLNCWGSVMDSSFLHL